MYKRTLLCSALALATFAPLTVNIAHAASSVSIEQAATDTMITAKIKALYAKSSLIKASTIHVTTTNQTVALSGKVKTNSQYERAITLADSVDNVKAIDAANLKVKASKAPLTDSYTTAKVKSVFLKEKLFGTKNIEYWPVNVETKDSVVYLTGKVDTNAQRTNLVQLAKAVTGVKSVNSSITVK